MADIFLNKIIDVFIEERHNFYSFNARLFFLVIKKNGVFMKLPVYTELSNYATRIGGKKISADISLVLIISSLSDPVNSINSIYQFVSHSKHKCEFIMINTDKEGYKYDKLLATFPLMRVILPQEKIKLKEAIYIAIAESLSNNILFMNEYFIIKSLDLDLLKMYLSESSFGSFIPLITNEKEEIIPGIIKGNTHDGFINTISTDIVGTAISSIYSKYFCFLLNKEACVSRDITLNDYEDIRYTLLEFGYKLWKEGYIITQIRNFKVIYSGTVINDIAPDFNNNDFLLFNFSNITDKNLIKGRRLKALLLIFNAIFLFKWKNIPFLFNLIKNSKKIIQENLSKPIEDSAIFSIINKDIK